MNYYIGTFFRALGFFIGLLFLARLMGRKQLAQFTFFDYVVGITIGSMTANVCVNRGVNTYDGIISIVVWGLMPILISYADLKSLLSRKVTNGTPLVVIQNGSVNDKNMKKSRLNMQELQVLLREKSIFDLAQVEFAILEFDGKLSVLKKSQYNPVTPVDMNITPGYSGLNINLIINGTILEDNLSMTGKDLKWLKNELSRKKITNEKDVILASLTSGNQLEVVMMDNLDKVAKV